MMGSGPDGFPDWDVIVIGTGMGGGTLGRVLAEQGHRVLFIEKGGSRFAPQTSSIEFEDADERLRHAMWPDRSAAKVDGSAFDSFLPLGCGVGGSTLLYGAALERFEPVDFEPDTDGETPSDGWPFDYATLGPYYDRAEAMYGVRGTRDPLGLPDGLAVRRPPPASPQDGLLMRDFAAAGLHPYRLHVGIEYKPGCKECLGYPCPIACKKDAGNSGVAPAVAAGATLLTDCEVTRLLADGEHIAGVEYRRDGQLEIARGRIVALAAGTYRSPALLLLSASEVWPQGVANSSGAVGRFLTLHGGDWFALWPPKHASTDGPRKAIGLRDFYHVDGERLGHIQSVGLAAGHGNILIYLHSAFDRSPFRRLRFLRRLLRIPARLAAIAVGPATVFASIIEDTPHSGNRIEIDPAAPEKIRIAYTVSATVRRRTKRSRAMLRKTLKNFRIAFITPEGTLNYAHATGTCRMGRDPATSVVDADCRAHDVDNLYVVDGACLPSGGGTNPSLTIAANAIRVADIIDARLRAGA